MTRLGLAAAGAFAVVALLSAQQPTFRSGVGAVALYASVTDREGRLVPGLEKTDFEVFDNGKPVELTLFSNEPQPATVALLLDMSESIVAKVSRVRDAAEQFIGALQPQDRVRIGTFGAEIAISPRLTGDRDVLNSLLREELWPGGAPPLWNAIYAGMSSLDAEPGRRVVLSLSDGTNSASLPGFPGSLAEVERKAIDDDFMIYAIGMEGSGLERRVADLADRTGGGHFEVKRDADLAATFARVADELRRQYLLGFVPSGADGKSHSLEVRMKPAGLKGRALNSYVQDSSSVTRSLTSPAAEAPAHRVGTPAVGTAAGILQVSVVSANGAPITDLTADEFRVVEGGQERPVGVSLPSDAKIAMLIDTSVGNEEAVEIAVSSPDLMRVDVGKRFGPSAIWDGVDTAIASLESAVGPKGVILVTDGRATGNRLSIAEVARHAWRAGVPVSAIVTAPTQGFAIGGTAMLLVHPEYGGQTLASDTGGIYEAHPAGSGALALRAKIERMADVVRKSYVLRFTAPADGLAHRVTVTVTRPGAVVKVAKGYVPSGPI